MFLVMMTAHLLMLSLKKEFIRDDAHISCIYILHYAVSNKLIKISKLLFKIIKILEKVTQRRLNAELTDFVSFWFLRPILLSERKLLKTKPHRVAKILLQY